MDRCSIQETLKISVKFIVSGAEPFDSIAYKRFNSVILDSG